MSRIIFQSRYGPAAVTSTSTARAKDMVMWLVLFPRPILSRDLCHLMAACKVNLCSSGIQNTFLGISYVRRSLMNIEVGTHFYKVMIKNFLNDKARPHKGYTL